jgi:hypothetical protein
MNDSKQSTRIAALRTLESNFQQFGCAPGAEKTSRLRKLWGRIRPRIPTGLRTSVRRRAVRRILQIGVVALAVIALGAGGLWMRLAAGPVSIDLITPLLSSAIEHTLGSRHRVEIGGTQIERNNAGRMSLRIRDILIRDADGAVIAGAPKAEVAVSVTGLLMGSLHAKRVSLVGAELAVRIETDGQITISTGAERRPIAVTPAVVKPAAPESPAQQQAVTAPGSASATQPTGAENFAALMAWIDRFAKGDTETEILGELGLKDGNLTVDDRRTGKTLTFEQINFSMNRYGRGGIVFSLGTDNEERPWQLTAAIMPNGFERRSVQIEARQISTRDILLAMRLDEGDFQFDVPVSGSIRAEIGPDFMPQVVEGRLTAEGGRIGNSKNEDESIEIDKAEMNLDWDSTRRSLVAPFKISSGRNRVTLLSQFEAPLEPGLPWRLIVTGGSIVLGPAQADEAPLVLNRILMRAALDPAKKRIELLQGEIAGGGVNLAMSGNIDFSSGEPRLSGGMVGTPMKGNLAKRIWPMFVASKVRAWVLENIQGGDVSRVEIAANAPMPTLKEDGPPIPDDGLSVEVDITNATVRPVDGLPPIREADLTTRIKGRNVVVNVGRGIVELESGRKLIVTNGVFEVPDTHPKSPPARARLKIEGPVAAAAELVALDRLKEASGSPLDPATSRGNVVGQISVGLPIMRDPPKSALNYTIALDVSNFGADKMMMGQKVEAQTLKVSANPQGFQIKGDIRINGTPAALDYRKPRNEAETDIRLQLVLDDAARARFGFDAGPALTGPVPVRLAGRMSGDKDARIAVEADLTQAKIENLMPGWVKPAGKPNRATFTVISKDKATRFEDLVIDGSGAQVKGSAELDSAGDLVSANFPVFALSDGDKTSLKADRATDGTLRLAMRGEVYDGRNFVKSVFGGQAPDSKAKHKFQDVDLDVRLGAIAGHNGEVLRGVDLKMTRRAGQIRTFTFTSKIGRDTALSGDLRGAARGRQVLYFETDDAGALFRFTDNYARMQGGQMWVAIDPPTPDQQPQEGLLNIRDFSIKGETSLDRVVSGASTSAKGVEFSRLKVEFTRVPGKLTIREGLLRGPTVGATLDGNVDFAKNDVRLRGTFVPLYGLNNAFGQIPIVGLFLGGSNEGLLGITFEVVGAPNAPVLRVNPISAVAPGLLRKFFEFPNAAPPAEQRPSAYSSPSPAQ